MASSFLRLFFAALFLFTSVMADARAMSCKGSLVEPIGLDAKLELLKSAGEKTSTFLFNMDNIEANPKKVAKYLRTVNALDVEHLSDKALLMLVKKHLALVYNSRRKMRSLPLKTLEQQLRAQVTLAFQELGYPIQQTRLGRFASFMENQTNRVRGISAIAVWLGIAAATNMQAWVPTYVPKLNPPRLTKEQKLLLAEKLPTLTPNEAVKFIEANIPLSNGFKIYQTIQKIYFRLSIVVLVYSVMTAGPVLSVTDDYVSFPRDMKEGVENVQYQVNFEFNKVLTSKESLRAAVKEYRINKYGIEYQDAETIQKITDDVNAMSFDELYAELN